MTATLPACDRRAPAVPAAATALALPRCAHPAAQIMADLDAAALVERLSPVVVSIVTTRAPATPEGQDKRSSSRPEKALGSGFIISPDGLVLTNDHVVSDALHVRVRLADDRAFDAEVVGRDPRLDVALLKLVGAERLPVAELGSSAALRVGEPVIAIGNPFGLGRSVTTGVVSATSRMIGAGSYDGFIQTDASINPGNSGGPLFNAAGQVIGIATAIHSEGQGISFALPIDDVRAVLPELEQTGRVSRARMGVTFQEVTGELARALRLPQRGGALVTDVEPGSPAARMGLQPGDVITELDGEPIVQARDLARGIRQRKPGDRVTIVYRRDGVERTATVKLDRAKGEDASLSPPRPRRATGNSATPLGISASDAEGGARIQAIDPQGPAAGRLEQGDLVLEMNGAPVQGGADLAARLRAATPDRDMVLRIRRDGTILFVVLRPR